MAHAPAALTPDQLTIARRAEAGEVTLTLRGEVDMGSAPALESELREAESSRPRRILLDLAALDFIDCTGIHLLADAQQRARANGHKLVLTHIPARVQRLFGLTGIGALLSVE